MTAWRSLVAWLAALSADPVELDREPARSYAAVSAAYATFAPVEPTPAPPSPPGPQECACGGKCVNNRFRPDGVIWQDCAPGCKSCSKRAAGAPCPDGTCPKPPAPRGG